MNSVFRLVNWIHWTRFVNLETEFVGLGFKAYKLSPKNSVCMPRNRVHWTRFASPKTKSKGLGFIWVHLSLMNHSKNFLTKNTEFQNTQSHSHSLSLSVSLSLSNSPLSLSLSLTLTLSLRHCRRRRRSVSASLSLSPSTKLLSSLLKLRKTSYFHWWVSDEEEALAVGVTSQSC